MKPRAIISIVMFLIAVLNFSLTGCKKDEDDTSQRAAIDNSTAENAFNDVFAQVDKAARETSEAGAEKFMQLDSGGCATVTITPFDTFTFPKTLTIDFGSSNCLCTDGKYRRGQITATLSGKYRDEGTVVTVTLQDYYVNDNHVQGTKTITNLGHIGTYGSGGNLKFSVVVSDASVTTPDGIISWNSTRTREWIEGEDTHWPNWQDDVYLIEGSADGTDKEGNPFNVTITSALRVALDCKWIESGTLDVTPYDKPVRSVDFGGGDCDANATVTINGVTYSFTMP
ncbi:MAG: hypothetical protein V1904_10410 [Bacteroidota bacterium]